MFCVFHRTTLHLVLYGVALGHVLACAIKIGPSTNAGMNTKTCKKTKLRENHLKHVTRLIN